MQNKKRPTSSLIVSTYNWPEALHCCLLSIRQQSYLPDEVIVADDGSTAATRELIEGLKTSFPVPLVHIWQPDAGFQLASIRNKAIAVAKFDYLIQIDGDLILHKEFIKDHLNFSEPGYFVTGSRVILDEAYSKKVLELHQSVISIFDSGVKNKTNGLRLPILAQILKGYRKNDIYYLRGCNMAFWKKDLLAVNGYNEEFEGWGREDNEIVVRLLNAGRIKKTMKYIGIVFHIYHSEKERALLTDNEYLLQTAIISKSKYASKGLNQYIH